MSKEAESLRSRLRTLYIGRGQAARWFQGGLFVFDALTVAYFLATAKADYSTAVLVTDLSIGAVLAMDFAVRFWIAENRLRHAFAPMTLVDAVVLASLLGPLLVGANLGFLRVLRLLRLLRGFRMARRLKTLSGDLRVNTRVVAASANLAVFIFVVTSMVWVLEEGQTPKLDSYLDALYFTITTLTTTGYGDIILEGAFGRLLTIGIMIFGVGFFLKLLQAIYQPDKVEVTCESCGLDRHDHDASHCKHCGETIYIKTEGDT